MTDGTYTLETYELAGSGAKALKIPKSADPSTGQQTWYYVESRQAIGFDGFLANNTNVLNGVLIHFGTESNGNNSYLFDMTPGSGSSIYLDWRDPALVVGQSFHDPEAGVTMTTEWVTGTAVTGTATTGTNGTAVYKLRLKREDPVGIYQVGAVAVTNGALSGSATTSFTVQ